MTTQHLLKRRFEHFPATMTTTANTTAKTTSTAAAAVAAAAAADFYTSLLNSPLTE